MRAATGLAMLPGASVVLLYQQSSSISGPPTSEFPWCQDFSAISVFLMSGFPWSSAVLRRQQFSGISTRLASTLVCRLICRSCLTREPWTRTLRYSIAQEHPHQISWLGIFMGYLQEPLNEQCASHASTREKELCSGGHIENDGVDRHIP